MRARARRRRHGQQRQPGTVACARAGAAWNSDSAPSSSAVGATTKPGAPVNRPGTASNSASRWRRKQAPPGARASALDGEPVESVEARRGAPASCWTPLMTHHPTVCWYLWTSGPLDRLHSFLVMKATFLNFFSLTVGSPLPPSTPHTDGRSSPNCTSFGSGLFMGFMGGNGNVQSKL